MAKKKKPAPGVPVQADDGVWELDVCDDVPTWRVILKCPTPLTYQIMRVGAKIKSHAEAAYCTANGLSYPMPSAHELETRLVRGIPEPEPQPEPDAGTDGPSGAADPDSIGSGESDRADQRQSDVLLPSGTGA